ncbi:type I restriction enzyme S subunit [Dysgonomonas sp. PH5-45]|nr:restriction endonuclease subunit S [Dysgonomonas sp. PH5-45]MDH6355911.1 type I restriction enzyme S subunit [Dysgonomonas sp. PH5-45]
MPNILNFPNLRFPEFTEEWKWYELRDVIHMFSGGTPPMQSPDYWNGNIPLISAISMHNTYISSSTQYITDIGLEKGSRLLQKENLLLLVRGSMLWNRIPICYNLIDVAFNQDVKGIVVGNKSTSLFVLYWFQSKETFLKSLVTGTGIGAGKLDSETIFSLQIALPNKIEQSKIAKFLSLLDQRIETQNKIIEKYESLIKGIIDYHFKRSAREDYLVKELGEYFSVMNLSKENLSETGAECILYGELFTTYGCVINEIKSRTAKDGNKLTLSSSNDLLFPSSTTVDAYSLISPSAILKEGVILGGDMFGIHINEKFNNEYLSYLFNYIYKNELARYAKGSTIVHLHYNEVKDAKIEIPSLEEQNKVTIGLRLFQEKISIEKNLLSTFQKQKEYLLRQMFI